MNKHIVGIPTNIITGFLGVGKTTTILHLLKHKPIGERWAVLVNEFGEIGVDGSLFQGQHQENEGVFIREVPGGCMCCAAGLPMQIALNQLLTKSKAHRLLIEPTGLGHPKEVLAILNAEHYRDILIVQKSVTLVDARKIRDPRYFEHETFNQQIDIADIIVGNKQDLYKRDDKVLLKEYVAERKGENTQIIFTDHGKLDPAILQGSSEYIKGPNQNNHQHDKSQVFAIDDDSIPECGFVKVENSGEGYHSIGWRFSPNKVFNRQALYAWLSGLEVERLKAVFITDEGVFGYNFTRDALTEVELDDCAESRVEIINTEIDSEWEEILLKWVNNKGPLPMDK